MNSEILDRVPPCSKEAERQLLAMIFVHPKIIRECDLRADEFYVQANAQIYGACRAIDAAGQPCDITLIVHQLKRDGVYESIGGAAYLAEVAIDPPIIAHWSYYAKIIRRKAQRRAMIAAGTNLLRNTWDETIMESDILAEADRALTEIMVSDAEREGWTAQEAVQATFDNIDEILSRGGTTGLLTGFRTFDEEIGGLFPGELAILGARSSIGKTAMAMQIAQWSATRGRLTYFVTLEMSMLNLMSRELCAAAGVNSVRLRTGTIDENERSQLMEAGQKLALSAIVIDDRATMKASDILRKARQLGRQGLRLVIVDYAQFVTPEDGKAVREQQVARITKDLKAIAKELKVSVLALSTLNKDAEKQGSSKLSHIRESDGVGYTADVVMTLERGEKGSKEENIAWLKVLKNRNGPVGKFELEWIPHRTRFACRGETIPNPLDNRASNRETAFDAFG